MGIIYNIEEAVKNSGFNVFQEPIKMIMQNQTEAFEKGSIIPKVFAMKTTDRYMEEYRSLTSMDGFKPTEDMEVPDIADFDESYYKQFKTQTWMSSFVISKQTMEDGSNIVPQMKAEAFIKGHGRTREIYAVNMLGAALGKTNAALKIGANAGLGMDTTDGTIEGTKRQYFHNTHYAAHDTNIVQSNKFYATLDFDGSAVEEQVLDVIGQVETIMARYVDDKGNIVPVEVNQIVLPQNYKLIDILTRGLKSRYGSTMDGNGVNNHYGKYELVISPYLSGVDGFEDSDMSLILESTTRNNECLGAVWFDRKPLEVRSYIDDKTEANVWTGRARYGAGFGDFRAMSYITFGNAETANATQITPSTFGVKSVKVINDKIKVDTELADDAQGTNDKPIVTQAKS